MRRSKNASNILVRKPLFEPSFQVWAQHYKKDLEELYLLVLEALAYYSHRYDCESELHEFAFGEFARFVFRRSSKFIQR